MGNNARMKPAVFFLFILLLFSLKSYAIGISSPYLANNTIKLIKGQSTVYTITLQNPEDADIDVGVGYSGKIAKIIDYKEIYTLPAGKIDTQISFFINASEEAKVGDIYTVSYSIKPLSVKGEGTLPISTVISKKFDVEVIKDPNSFDMRLLWYYGGFAVALLVLVIFMWRRPRYKF